MFVALIYEAIYVVSQIPRIAGLLLTTNFNTASFNKELFDYFDVLMHKSEVFTFSGKK